MSGVHSKIRELRARLRFVLTEHPPVCFFCGKPIDPESCLGGDADDGVLVHHKDHNHYNDVQGNRAWAHRGCHLAHHRHGQFEEKAPIGQAFGAAMFGFRISDVETLKNTPFPECIEACVARRADAVVSPCAWLCGHKLDKAVKEFELPSAALTGCLAAEKGGPETGAVGAASNSKGPS